ncbi:MAG: XylR N-terminal domain-containing protein, partial [Pseudomonadota bacterium]
MKETPLSLPPMQDLRELLRFEANEGRIWLGEERMVLLGSSEMRALRRELIESLGMERARSALMRMGFSAGETDA